MTDFLRSGRPSLDLAWTVRYRSVWPTETLVDTDALEHWIRGTYPAVTFDPELVTDEFLAESRDLRAAVYRLVRASINRLSVAMAKGRVPKELRLQLKREAPDLGITLQEHLNEIVAARKNANGYGGPTTPPSSLAIQAYPG